MSEEKAVAQDAQRQKNDVTRLSFWLLISLGLIFGMVVIGGLTRLTGSGLSMVTWKPLTGFFPPVTLSDWQALFQEYQSSPEFLKINFDMSLEDFKSIFWLEFIHRVWGRLIGITFLVPLILCLKSPFLRKKYALPLFAIWCLGGLQGVVGWYMVKSGLVHDPAVSPYRLALHLFLAFLTFSFIQWLFLKLKAETSSAFGEPMDLSEGRPLPPFVIIGVLVFFCLTVFYGALVAGLKAGLLYNTFPTMNGDWLPDGFFATSFTGKSFLEEPGIVQWVHRCLALSTFSLLVGLWIYGRNASRLLKPVLNWMLACGVLQVCLGIMTLILHVPVFWGVCHQAGALITLSTLVTALFISRTTASQAKNFRAVKRQNAGQFFSLQGLQESASSKG